MVYRTDDIKTSLTESDTSGSTWSQGLTMQDFTKQLFLSLEKQNDNISFVYKESLRAVKEIFSNLQYFQEDSSLITIQCIHGNPERTIAKLKQDNNIILPIISVVQTGSEEDDKRRRPRQMVLRKKVWSFK